MVTDTLGPAYSRKRGDPPTTIGTLSEKCVFAIPPMVEYLDSLGRGGQHEYLLNKRDSLIVVAQLCPEFTARIVDRWQELEAAQVVQVPTSFAAFAFSASELPQLVPWDSNFL